jgi:hypothetical protein
LLGCLEAKSCASLGISLLQDPLPRRLLQSNAFLLGKSMQELLGLRSARMQVASTVAGVWYLNMLQFSAQQLWRRQLRMKVAVVW